MHSDLTYKVRQLRAVNHNVMITAVTVLVAALFTTALLPTLLVQYVYAGQQLFETPPLLEFIPLASFVIGMGYFIYAIVSNMLRAKRASYLDKKIELEGGNEYHHHNMDEVDSLAEALVSKKAKPAAKAKAATKKTAAKSSAKTTRRRTAKK